MKSRSFRDRWSALKKRWQSSGPAAKIAIAVGAAIIGVGIIAASVLSAGAFVVAATLIVGGVIIAGGIIEANHSKRKKKVERSMTALGIEMDTLGSKVTAPVNDITTKKNNDNIPYNAPYNDSSQATKNINSTRNKAPKKKRVSDQEICTNIYNGCVRQNNGFMNSRDENISPQMFASDFKNLVKHVYKIEINPSDSDLLTLNQLRLQFNKTYGIGISAFLNCAAHNPVFKQHLEGKLNYDLGSENTEKFTLDNLKEKYSKALPHANIKHRNKI